MVFVFHLFLYRIQDEIFVEFGQAIISHTTTLMLMTFEDKILFFFILA